MQPRALETAVLLALAATYCAHAPATESFNGSLDTESCSREFPQNCLNGVSTAVTSSGGLRVTGSRVSERSREVIEEEQGTRTVMRGAPGSGLAAGDTLGGGWGVWGNYTRAAFDSKVTVAPYDATLDAFTVGVDRLFAERWVAGLLLGYEDGRSRTFFNGGGQDSEGVLVAPYLAVLISDVFSADVSGGYTAVSYDQTRIDPVDGSTLVGDLDADRWFVAGNLNAVVTSGDWVLGARAGLLYIDEEQDAYSESGGPSARTLGKRNADLTQALIGFDAGYQLGDFQPYAFLTYRNDLGQDDGRSAGGLPAATGPTQADDDDEVETGFGLRYYGAQGLSGSFEWLATVGREDFDNQTLMLTLRLDL